MDGAILKAFIKEKQLNRTELAEALGMSKQNLYQLFKSKSFEQETIDKIERKFRIKWDKIKEGVNIDTRRQETPQKQEISPNGIRQDYLSGKNLENFSEAQRVLAETNRFLITVRGQPKNSQDQTLVQELYRWLQEFAGGKKTVSVDDLKKELQKASTRDNSYTQ